VRLLYQSVNPFADGRDVLEMLTDFLQFVFVHYYYKRNAFSICSMFINNVV
jgi:hypothetical protein